MKSLRKILAVLVATAMVAGMGLMAFADTNNLFPDKKITVGGLDNGDVVRFYRVLEFSGTAGATGGWVATTDFAGVLNTTEKIQKLLQRSGTVKLTGSGTGVTSELATALAAAARATSEQYSGTASGTSITRPISGDVTPGLYIALITPSKTATIYNPVFVGADYEQSGSDNESHVWQIEPNSGSYADGALAKKETITLNKSAKHSGTRDDNLYSKNSGTDANTAQVGDVILFTVETTIPEYGSNYGSGTFFKVSDVLTAGLTLDSGSIKVYSSGTALSPSTDYELKNTDAQHFTVDFKNAYIMGLNAAQPITITYNAKLNSGAAPSSINQQDNTVTLEFSNNPNDASGTGTLKDKTNHYIFDIDANLFGDDSYEATEVVKVGLDADGNEIKKIVKLSNSGTVGALQGAKFGLYKDSTASSLYSNDIFSGTVITGADGRMEMKGLDAGTYWLKEISAPDGYVKDPTTYKIEIIPTFDRVTVNEGSGSQAVQYDVQVLKSYTIKVNGATTAEYTVTTSGTSGTSSTGNTHITSVNKGDANKIGYGGLISGTSGSRLGKIQNTQGTALPSTGGIGTTIFYCGGAILVLLAGVLLVSKRRIA